MEEFYKEDLFPDPGHLPGRKKKRKSRIKRERYLKITEERIAFFGILFLFIIVGSYVIGYKKGAALLDYKKVPDVVLSDISVKEMPKQDVAQPPVLKKEVSQPKDVVLDQVKQYFALQVVAYKNISYAESEKKNLEKSGFPAYIEEAGTYRIVYVGPYSSKSEADAALVKLKSRYRDAFIKKVQRR
ncbi:MAG: SPOR domain-containing protein [Candidatus Omnitrophica bacterium]|nr:SPOR domain-containing protein [Candidatus Omnitrophota bacterium]